MRERFSSLLAILSKPVVALGGALVIGVIAIALALHSAAILPSGNFVVTKTDSITAGVDVAGVVKAANSTDLSFQTSGRVARIDVKVGDHVGVGQTLVVLDGSSQAAAVSLAKANLEVQQTKLAALTAGTRPEQLAIDQTAVTQAQNALTNALSSAYIIVDDAVHAKADQVFTNPRSSIAQLSILVPDATLVNKIQTERIALEPVLSSWANMLSSGTGTDITTSSESNMKNIAAFLNDLTSALAEAQSSGSISAATLVGYQASVNIGRSNVSTGLSAVISADTAYEAAIGALTLAQAGATANDIAAQKAAVDAAQASVDAAMATAFQAVIVAPVSGTITAQNANLGETVVPSVPLVSMIADGKYEADAQISETDIAKVKLNDKVEVAFAGYPGVNFAAMVTTVAPSAIMNGGVAAYPVTVTFLNNDARLLPGLSANLHIITATKDAALVVPSSAIVTNGSQEFVYVKGPNGNIQTPVTIGIKSTTGMTEILSGLSAGDQILAFGASASQ